MRNQHFLLASITSAVTRKCLATNQQPYIPVAQTLVDQTHTQLQAKVFDIHKNGGYKKGLKATSKQLLLPRYVSISLQLPLHFKIPQKPHKPNRCRLQIFKVNEQYLTVRLEQ